MSLFWLVLLACTWVLFIGAFFVLRHKEAPEQAPLARANPTSKTSTATMAILLVLGVVLSIITIVAIYWLIEGEAKNPFTENSNPHMMGDFQRARNVQNLKKAALRSGINMAGQYGRSLASKFTKRPQVY